MTRPISQIAADARAAAVEAYGVALWAEQRAATQVELAREQLAGFVRAHEQAKGLRMQAAEVLNAVLLAGVPPEGEA